MGPSHEVIKCAGKSGQLSSRTELGPRFVSRCIHVTLSISSRRCVFSSISQGLCQIVTHCYLVFYRMEPGGIGIFRSEKLRGVWLETFCGEAVGQCNALQIFGKEEEGNLQFCFSEIRELRVPVSLTASGVI